MSGGFFSDVFDWGGTGGDTGGGGFGGGGFGGQLVDAIGNVIESGRAPRPAPAPMPPIYYQAQFPAGPLPPFPAPPAVSPATAITLGELAPLIVIGGIFAIMLLNRR